MTILTTFFKILPGLHRPRCRLPARGALGGAYPRRSGARQHAHADPRAVLLDAADLQCDARDGRIQLITDWRVSTDVDEESPHNAPTKVQQAMDKLSL